jgi:hypothetical protein
MLTDDEKRTLSCAVRARRTLTERELISRLRDVANSADLSEVLALLPAAIASQLTESVAREPTLRAVGYWKAPADRIANGERFPDPEQLVRPDWCVAEREQILAYLRAGQTYAQWRGLSHCRFKCGVSDWEMGSRCLTDGVWVWPEGLPHYLEHHCVRLPDEFVENMQVNGWHVPQDATAITSDVRGLPSSTFWLTWAESLSSSRGT